MEHFQMRNFQIIFPSPLDYWQVEDFVTDYYCYCWQHSAEVVEFGYQVQEIQRYQRFNQRFKKYQRMVIFVCRINLNQNFKAGQINFHPEQKEFVSKNQKPPEKKEVMLMDFILINQTLKVTPSYSECLRIKVFYFMA